MKNVLLMNEANNFQQLPNHISHNQLVEVRLGQHEPLHKVSSVAGVQHSGNVLVTHKHVEGLDDVGMRPRPQHLELLTQANLVCLRETAAIHQLK